MEKSNNVEGGEIKGVNLENAVRRVGDIKDRALLFVSNKG